MKALINPEQNNLVCDIHEIGFDVASPLFWVDCDESISVHKFKYENNSFVEYIPESNQLVVNSSTKEVLLAQLQELTAKINALS